MNDKSYNLIHGDALEVMKTLADNSVDLCLTDPPYGTTACKWDSVIPFEPMWKELKRIAKPKAAICLFGSQPFTSALVMSNLKDFKYEWIWNKSMVANFGSVKYQPLRQHELVCVFSTNTHIYKPQFRDNVLKPFGKGRGFTETPTGNYGVKYQNGVGYPKTILDFPRPNNLSGGGFHPTQKPVELLRYLIRTYTLENDTVLDFTMGSGSTGVACILENRKFIGIEKDESYFEIAEGRTEEALYKQPLFAKAA